MKTVLLTIMAAWPVLAFGQAATPAPQPTPSAARVPLWKCDLEGGTYEVAIHSIVSVSTHEYIADGLARVTEMNIDTVGNMAVRFYYLEPVAATTPDGIGQSTIDRAKELADQVVGRVVPADQQPWQKVVKNYPTSTHAHTIEYRVESLDELQALFKSADTAFRLNQNTEVRVP